MLIDAVGGGGGKPGGEGPGFRDPFLEHLPILRLFIGGQFAGIFRLVELPLGGVNPELPEHPLHAKGTRLVRDDGHNALLQRLIPKQGRENAHKGHGGGNGTLSRALEHGLEGLQGRSRQALGGHAALGHGTPKGVSLPLHVAQLRAVRLRPVVGHLF